MSSHAQQPTLDAFSEQTSPPTALVYTDGGCDPNPGPGGWAAVLQIFPAEDVPIEVSEVVLTGNHPQTTNNRMELEAAIAALAYLHGRYGACQVELHTDSRYVRSGIRRWIQRWVANGWQTQTRQAVKNRDLWRRLYELCVSPEAVLSVDWHWVKGHAGDPLNERVDHLAGEARARLLAGDVARPSLAPEPTHTPIADRDVKDAVAPPPPLVVQEGDTVQLSVAVVGPSTRGPGGWGAVLSKGASKEVLSGHESGATSNSLALEAALSGLRALESPVQVTVYTTEEYLSKGASEWVHEWRRRDWRTSGKKPVKHRERWQALLQAAEPHHVTWQHVRKSALTADLAEAKQAAAAAARNGA
jgi:ribonuclease HI